jgi:hypothetical protein
MNAASVPFAWIWKDVPSGRFTGGATDSAM